MPRTLAPKTMSGNQDEPMEDTNVQDETNNQKDEITAMDENLSRRKANILRYRQLPKFLTCQVCSSMYQAAVRMPCCKKNACRACAESHIAANNVCWNQTCGKEVLVGDLLENFALMRNVEKKAESQAKFREGLKTGAVLRCCVCQEICKRGVILPCCGTAVCRGCAVKKITVKRGCWVEGCETIGVTGEELINDELLRSAIDNYMKEGVVDEEQAIELILNKNKKRFKKKTKKTNKRKKGDMNIEKKQVSPIELYIEGIPEGTSKEDIKEVFATISSLTTEKNGSSILEVTQDEKLKTATIACKHVRTANSILEQKDTIKIGESSLKITLSKANKCDDLRLYLTGMASDTTEEELKDFLEKYGSVKKLKMDSHKNDFSRLYAIVEFEEGLSLRKIVNENCTELNGHKIVVSLKYLRSIYRLLNVKNQETAEPKTAPPPPMVNIKGIFLKKDEDSILKLLEQFGKIEESKFFTKDLENIPSNAEKLTGKERKKIASRAEIRYKTNKSAINAISREQLIHEGHTLFITHVNETGSTEFKSKLAGKLATAKLALEKQAAMQPMVRIQGIFLKKDEGAILKLLEKFGKIEESKFFIRDLEEIPANAEELTGKERKKITSTASIRYKTQKSVITAICKKQLTHEGHTLFISHVNGTGSEEFKTKLVEKLATAKLAMEKLAAMQPMVGVQGIFLKKDEGAILKLLEKFGKIEDSKFFMRDLEEIPSNAKTLTGKERKKLASRAVIRYKKQNPAITAICTKQFVHEGHTILISHLNGSGSEAFKTKLAEKMSETKTKPPGDLRSVAGFNTAIKRDSRGMWQNMAQPQPSLEIRMRQKMNQMMQQWPTTGYTSGYGAYNPMYGGGAGAMGQNGGGNGQIGGGMGLNGGGSSIFNNDFTSVTGMKGAKKGKFPNKPSRFDSGMSSQRMGTDFNLGSSSSMSSRRATGYVAGYGMGGAYGGGYGMGGGQEGFGSRQGGLGGGWFSQ